MQYLVWGSVQIPLCFVSGFSYSKRARTVEHSGGYISARGFEAAEISVKVTISRAFALACELDFDKYYRMIDEMAVTKDGEQGAVTLGGYPIYPELNFALTNINRTYVTDLSTNAAHTIEADLVLSGTSCVKEVSRERTLIFDEDDVAIELPKVTIACGGKSLAIQDTASICGFTTTPDRLDLEILLGQDTQTVERDGFLTDLIGKQATVKCELPQGDVTFNVIECMLIDNLLSISGSVFTEAASQEVTKTFADCDLADILRDVCDQAGVEADIKVSGQIDYYLQKATPLNALRELQGSAGFIVSIQGNKVTVVDVPDSISAQKSVSGVISDDSLKETISGIVWRDGHHEHTAGDDKGEIVKLDACFMSDEAGFATKALRFAQYRRNALRIDAPIDDTIGSHSQVKIAKDDSEIAVLCEYPSFDWLAGTMSIECRIVT
ncbi:MAG: hypothetical protein IJ268_05745 [Proteobacteria bacterium]|nr:hypothetical protein [Pseudomonadota bacterium]